MKPARPVVLALLALALLTGCPKQRAARSLAAAEIVRVESLSALPDGVGARVQVQWPGQRGPICLDRVDWAVEGAPELFLVAEPETPCGDAVEADPTQWLAVRSTGPALTALAGGDPGGVTRVQARVRGVELDLEGSSGPGLKLADGCVVEVGGAVGARGARLEVTGLPPAARVYLGVFNPLPVDLETDAASWTFLRGGEPWAGGPLEVPPTLAAGAAFEVSAELGAEEALALATATVMGVGSLSFEAMVDLVTPWGRVTVEASFEL